MRLLADGSIKIDTSIKRKGAEQDLNELKRTVDAKVKQITQELNKSSKEVENLNNKFNETSVELSSVETQMDMIGDRIFESFRDFQKVTPEDQFDKFIQSQIEADKEYQKLVARQKELTNQADDYKKKIEQSKNKNKELTGTLSNVKQEQAKVNEKVRDAKEKTEELNKRNEKDRKK